MPPLRLVFFGTPDIAVPTLEALIAGPHEVVGVVSQPDRARGRGRKTSPSPVSAVALREGIPLLRPERVGNPEVVEALSALSPDLGVVVAFGQFLPKSVRELPGRGFLINAHASLLPKFRGAAPIARAILEGESETGISVMRIEREMDAGPVGLVLRTPIEEGENTAELSERLSRLAARAIEEAIDRIARDEIEWTEQDARRASFAPKLEKADALLDLRESAPSLVRRIHALAPKPGGTLTLISEAGDQETVLKVSRAKCQPFESTSATDSNASPDDASESAPAITRSRKIPRQPSPGTIERDTGGVALRVATGDGWLVPLVLQRPGGKALATRDFLRGFSLPADARFACPPENASSEPKTDPEQRNAARMPERTENGR